MEVVAFVDGTVEQGPFDDEVKVTGKVILGSNFDENPYAFPYQVELDGVSGDDSYRITGELFEDGTVDLKVSLPGSGWSDPVGTHSLEPVELEGGF